MTILIFIIEPSSSNRWKQIQRFIAKHWAELPESSQREGREIDYMSKRVKIMMGKPTEIVDPS